MYNYSYPYYGAGAGYYSNQPYSYGIPNQGAATYPQMQQQQQNPNNAQSQNTNVIYVNGIDDVKNRQLPFNSNFAFFDNDNPVLYRKTVDSTGKMTVEAFDIIPHEEEPKTEPKIDMSQYVLKSDFEALKREIERLRTTARPAAQNAPKPQPTRSTEV